MSPSARDPRRNRCPPGCRRRSVVRVLRPPWRFPHRSSASAPPGRRFTFRILVAPSRPSAATRTRSSDSRRGGTAVSLLPDGRVRHSGPAGSEGIPGLPGVLEGVPVTPQVTGRFMASAIRPDGQRPGRPDSRSGIRRSPPAPRRARAGRVRSGCNVLSTTTSCQSNGAAIGDPTYQPGPYDGGTGRRSDRDAHRFSDDHLSSHREQHHRPPPSRSPRPPCWIMPPADTGYGLAERDHLR